MGISADGNAAPDSKSEGKPANRPEAPAAQPRPSKARPGSATRDPKNYVLKLRNLASRVSTTKPPYGSGMSSAVVVVWVPLPVDSEIDPTLSRKPG